MSYLVKTDLNVKGNNTTPGAVSYDDGTDKITVSAPTSLAGSYSFTLPDAAGTIGQLLQLGTGGATSWVDPPTVSIPILYDAIVAPTGGDYTLPSAAISGGAITMFIRKGTYSESSSLTLPDGCVMFGESKGETIIDFGNSANGIIINGNGGSTETTGTIDVINNSLSVSGTGTTFTNLSVGDYILIGDSWHEISTISNDTSLNISFPYQGTTKNGLTYIGSGMHNIQLDNLIIQNSTTNALSIDGAIESTFNNICIRNSLGLTISNTGLSRFLKLTCENNTENMDITSSNNVIFDECILRNGSTRALDINANVRLITFNTCCFSSNNEGIRNNVSSANSISFNNCLINDNLGDGIVITGSNFNIGSCHILNNGGSGVCLDGTISSINNCQILNNGTNGIDLSGDNNLLKGNICDSNTIGINVDNTLDHFIIDNCKCNNNSSHGILLGTTGVGNYPIISNCVCTGNGGWGINVAGLTIDNGIINGCRCRDNTSGGLQLVASTQNDWIITSNNFRNNTGTNFSNASTGAITANNFS